MFGFQVVLDYRLNLFAAKAPAKVRNIVQVSQIHGQLNTVFMGLVPQTTNGLNRVVVYALRVRKTSDPTRSSSTVYLPSLDPS